MAKYRIKVLWEREDEDEKRTLASYIDHTNLSATASEEDITKLCEEAKEHGFATVCVNPVYVRHCAQLLKDSDVGVCTVVGFPLGQNTSISKIYETVTAVNDGADEIDMVINIPDLKARNNAKIVKEVNDVVKAAGDRIVKVIVETAYLDEDDKIYAMKVLSMTMAQYIKTSTGFGPSGAKLEDIKMWNDWKKKNFSFLKIKAAGGIRTNDDFLKFIEAGADRIGTSKGVDIILNTTNDPEYFKTKVTKEKKVNIFANAKYDDDDDKASSSSKKSKNHISKMINENKEKSAIDVEIINEVVDKQDEVEDKIQLYKTMAENKKNRQNSVDEIKSKVNFDKIAKSSLNKQSVLIDANTKSNDSNRTKINLNAIKNNKKNKK